MGWGFTGWGFKNYFVLDPGLFNIFETARRVE